MAKNDFAIFDRVDDYKRAIEKIEQAKRLVEEARSVFERRSVFKKIRKIKKIKKTKAFRVNYGVNLPDELSSAEKSVLAAIKAGSTTMVTIASRAHLKNHVAKTAARQLKARKLIVLEGHGFSSAWKAV